MVSFLLSVFFLSFFARCLFLAYCWHSDSAACPLCFIGSVCSCRTLCARMNLERIHCWIPAYPLSQIPHRNVHSHCTWPWTYLSFFAFSFVFWLQSRPTVNFVLLRCIWNTHRGKLSAVKWVQCHSRYWSTYLIEPRWHKGLGLVSRRNGLKQAGNTEELQPTTAAKVFLSSSFVLRVIGKFLAPWLTCEQNKNDNNKVFILSYLFVPKKMIFAS